MLFQIPLCLDIALTTDVLLWHLLTIYFDIASFPPIEEHLTKRITLDTHPLAQGIGFFSGKDFGQEVEQVLRPFGHHPFLFIFLRFDGIAKELHLAIHVVLERPSHEILTRAEAGQMRQRMGVRSGSLRQMLGNWTHRGYIELYGEELPKQDVDRQRYIKTETYLRKHPQR